MQDRAEDAEIRPTRPGVLNYYRNRPATETFDPFLSAVARAVTKMPALEAIDCFREGGIEAGDKGCAGTTAGFLTFGGLASLGILGCLDPAGRGMGTAVLGFELDLGLDFLVSEPGATKPVSSTLTAELSGGGMKCESAG